MTHREFHVRFAGGGKESFLTRRKRKCSDNLLSLPGALRSLDAAVTLSVPTAPVATVTTSAAIFTSTTIVTAAAMTTTATTSMAAAATAAMTTAATATAGAIFGFTDTERASAKFCTFEVVYGRFSNFAAGKRDKGKAARAAGIAIERHMQIDNRFVFRQKFA